MHHIAGGHDRCHVTVQRVAGSVARTHASQRRPGADIVPAKRAWDDEDAITAFEHADIHADGLHSAEKSFQRLFAAGTRNFRTVRLNFLQKTGGAPDEDAGVPEAAGRDQFARADTIGFFEKSRHLERNLAHALARLDVAKARIGTRRRDANGDQRIVGFRHVRRAEQRIAEPIRITDRPVGMHREHDGVWIARCDDTSGPRQGRGGAGRPRFGDHIGGRHFRQHRGDGRPQRGVGQDQHALAGYQRQQAIHRVAQHRLPGDQRQELLRECGRADRPETRTDPTGENDGPERHV